MWRSQDPGGVERASATGTMPYYRLSDRIHGLLWRPYHTATRLSCSMALEEEPYGQLLGLAVPDFVDESRR